MRIIKTDAGLEYLLKQNIKPIRISDTNPDPAAEEVNAIFGREEEMDFDSMRVWKDFLMQGYEENLAIIEKYYQKLHKNDAYHRFQFSRSSECWLEFEVEQNEFAKKALIEKLDDGFAYKKEENDCTFFIYSSWMCPIYFVNIYDSFVRCGGSDNVTASLGSLISNHFEEEKCYVQRKYLAIIETLYRCMTYVIQIEPEKKEIGIIKFKDFDPNNYEKYELAQIHFPPFWMIPEEDLEVHKL